MTLHWTQRSLDDLFEIGRSIARDKPGAAREWVDRLQRKARQAAGLPRSWRTVPEVNRDDIREMVERGYRIVYRVQEDVVQILTVFEDHRRLPIDRESLEESPDQP